MVNTFCATLPVHSHVARPSTEEEQVAALVASGKITTSTMWRTCGAVAYNSQVMFKAHADYTPPRQPPRRAQEEGSARDKAEAEAAALAARAKRRAAGDDKLELKDLKTAVKFTTPVSARPVFLSKTRKSWAGSISLLCRPLGTQFSPLSLTHPRSCRRTRTNCNGRPPSAFDTTACCSPRPVIDLSTMSRRTARAAEAARTFRCQGFHLASEANLAGLL